MELQAFSEIALILLAAVAVGGVGMLLRQPLIVSFIAVGILVGPAGLSIVTKHEEIELLASIGIAMLLFVVGLKLDVHMIRTVGPVALASGLGQVIFTSVFGFGITLALGFAPIPALYIAVALTFSSTIIIVKLLSDKREIDALHGRIAVGFLIVQDVVVILVMIALTALGAGLGAEGDGSVAIPILLVALKGLASLGVVLALSKWVLPGLVSRLARSSELLVLFGITWAVALAAAGDLLGFSKEVGAFLAGVSLASTPYREAITGRLVTVRDFLLLFFFIDLGARLDMSLLASTLVPSIVLSLFVLVGNPVIVMVIMGLMGYRKRTGFLAGLAVAQISEFSLILGALGVSLGHVGGEAMGLITSVGLVTIGLSTYLILYSGPIYAKIAPWLGVFERRTPYREVAGDSRVSGPRPDIILFGLGRYGGGIARHLRLRKRQVLGVDFDPQALARWREAGLPVIFGDAEDPELFEHLPLTEARWVVSTAPDAGTSRVLLRHLQQRGFAGRVAVACRTPDEQDSLRRAGASVILRPFEDAAEQAVDALTSAMEQVEAVAPGTPGLREVRLPAASAWAGHTIAELEFRERFQSTVLAVSRSGRSFLHPGPDFRIFPSDRLILSGEPEGLDRAVEDLTRIDIPDSEGEAPDFQVMELALDGLLSWHGRSLAELDLRKRFEVTVVSIRTPDGQLISPGAGHVLVSGDRLLVAGVASDLQRLRALAEVGEGPARQDEHEA